jgi:transcriptional regulator with XRE-family HTH domain
MGDPYIVFKNLRKARLAADLTQEDLAEKIGVSNKTISAYETGRAIPPTSVLIEIAKVTGVSISKIISNDKVSYFRHENMNKLDQKLTELENRVSNLEQTIVKLVKLIKLDE